MASPLDGGSAVSLFELKSRYYVHFRTNILEKSMKLLIPPDIGKIVQLLFFYKDSAGIKKRSM